MKPLDHSDPINGAMCEVISAMSALNMQPDPLTETGDPDSNGYLSEVDGWAKHAMEHLNAAASLLMKAQTPRLVASTDDLNVLETLRNRAWHADDKTTVAALDRVLLSRLPYPPDPLSSDERQILVELCAELDASHERITRNHQSASKALLARAQSEAMFKLLARAAANVPMLKCAALTEADVMALVWVRQFADHPARAALDKIISFFTRTEG